MHFLRSLTTRFVAALALVALCAPDQLRAQQNIPSDTIVRLAIEPSRLPGRPVVQLLEEAVNRIEPDGRWTQTFRQVHQVLDASAVAPLSEREFNFAKTHQVLTINWVRVLRTTGQVVTEKAAQEQESDVSAALANPVYQELRRKRISLAGVAPGTIVDVSWTVEEKEPARAGDFLFQWRFANPVPTVRSRFVVDVPESFSPRIQERFLNFRRREVVKDGRAQLEWNVSNIDPYRPEPFEADSNGVVMSVSVAGVSSWNDVARWYHALSRDRMQLTPAAGAHIDSVVHSSGARTRLDSIRAVHQLVAQDIRYMAIALGQGGYQPRFAHEVLSSGFGDCKDKATLFVAALKRYRIPAYPVLLANTGRSDPSLPGIGQFNHVIAAVGDGANRVYTDLTANVIPYGELPDSYQGAFGLVISSDGSGEEIRFPAATPDDNLSRVQMTFTLDTNGVLAGHVREELHGSPASGARLLFAPALDSTRRALLSNEFARRMFPNGAVVDSLVPAESKKLYVPLVYSYRIRSQDALKPVGSSRILLVSPMMRGPAATFGNMLRSIEALPPRVTPIDASRVLGNATGIIDLHITLPPGWKAELPRDVLATSFFGSYESTWTQEGNELHLVRKLSGGRGIYPPQRIVEVLTWLKTVAADNYEFITLKPAS